MAQASGLGGAAARAGQVASVAALASLSVAIIFLFVGLDRSSLWYDELITVWIAASPDAASWFSRVASDVHPPLYYALIRVWAGLGGLDSLWLRLPSAMAAAFTLGLLAVALPVGRPARLLVAAMAGHSLFVVVQAQNARSYTLALLLVTAMMLAALHLLRRPEAPIGLRWLLVGTAALAAACHPYAMLAALACLLMLALLRADCRGWLVPALLVIGALAAVWQLGVLGRFSQYSTSHSWIPGNPWWILLNLVRAGAGGLGLHGGLLLLMALVAGRAGADRRLMLLLLAVPLMVLLAAVVLTLAGRPNVVDRNLLVLAPFVWAMVALLLDRQFGREDAVSAVVALVAGAAVLWAASIVALRQRAITEPFRETAAAIAADPRCRAVAVLALNAADPAWSVPAHEARLQTFTHSWQLGHGNRAVSLVAADALAGRAGPLIDAAIARARSGCPVLAFRAHGAGAPLRLAAYLDGRARRQGAAVHLQRVAANRVPDLDDYAGASLILPPLPPRFEEGYLFVVRQK